MRTLAPRAAAVLVAIVAIALPRGAFAARTHFEPTDLSLQDPGILELDLQLGMARSNGPWRAVLPDAELNLGLSNRVEIDLDFGFGVEGKPGRPFTFDHLVTDNVWLASKLGIWDSRDEVARTAWAFGIQMGPKLPVGRGAYGIGYEALLLFGRTIRTTHVVVNAGALIDPGAEVARRRPIGVEYGIDLDQDLGKDSDFSILAELGGLHWFTADPDQLQFTAGVQWSANDFLDLSVSGLVGLPPGSDHYALLIGVSPKVRLWQ
ncbi:MAG: hypothetical protein ABJE95_25135 [Byssovorax sp.]